MWIADWIRLRRAPLRVAAKRGYVASEGVPLHYTHRQNSAKNARNGVAILSFVAALLIIGTLVLWLFHLTATSSQATLGHFFSVGAFYAAESGLEMGLRELKQSPPNDIDSDGLAGTISSNGNPNDDPALATGVFYMERVGTSPPTYRATGRPAESTLPWSTYRRVIEIRLQ